MLRRLPGALTLGLLAAFASHALVYGNGHVMGGAYADALRSLAAAAVTALAAFWTAIAWVSRGRVSNGSILACSMASVMPSVFSVIVAASGWFYFVESVESGHSAPPSALIVGALVIAGGAVTFLSRAVLRALAKIVFAMKSGGFKRRSPWTPVADTSVSLEPVARTWRLFSRPPPMTWDFLCPT
ncbi:MAG: hypothetical protein WB526_09995 [Candidatus Cybelea sp.]